MPRLPTTRYNRTAPQGGRGGAIFARNGQATLTGNTFLNSQAALEGGAIYLSADGSSVRGGTIQGSVAGDGAGIYIDGPLPGASPTQPWIDGVSFTGNNAGNHGGALFLRNSGAQITLNVISSNTAAVDGGGAYLQESTPSAFSGNVLRNNQAGDQGGGLYLTRRTTGRYSSNAIIDNSATQGGGVYIGGASPTFVHTTLARNGSALVAQVQDGNETTIVLSNTIVSGHVVGIQGESGATVALYTTLWHENGANLFGSGNLGSSSDIEGNPRFQADGYHIHPDSAAANKGLAGDVALGSDVDNEGRFQGNGPEIGADELTAACAVIVAGSPNDVYNNLQQAINAAPNNGELRVAGTCTGVTMLDGASQLAYFNKSVTVRGGYSPNNWETSLPATQPTVLDAKKLGRVVRVISGVSVGLANLTLINGSAAGLGGAGNLDVGGNLFVDGAQLVMDNVTVVNGYAALGGGLFLRSPIARVSNSIFRNNFAVQAGGAVYLDNAPVSAQIGSSTLSNNRAANGGAIYAAGGAPILLGNTLLNNQTNGNGNGGGIYLAASNATVNRNRMESNRAGLGGAIYVTGGSALLTNNMFIRNAGMIDGGALYSINHPADLRHNTFVANSTVQSGGSALLFATPTSNMPLSMTNSILVDHTRAISVATGNQLSMRATLWNNNGIKWFGVVTEGANTLDQDPLFVDAMAGNYRLSENSPAVDAGINIGVIDDIDGQARPARQGFDIGADEYLRSSINATLNALPNPVASGATQTYLLQVINNGDVDVVARVQITLPSALTPQTSPVWENVAIARGAVWEKSLAAVVAENFTGPINALMVVTTNEGATASAAASTTAAAVSGEILEFSGESLPDPAPPGSTIELDLRMVNRGGIPLVATVQTLLPAGLTSNGPLQFTPSIAAPDGVWTMRIEATIDPDLPIVTDDGGFNALVTTFLVETNQGTNHEFKIVTTLARPAIEISRIPSPQPASAGQQFVYSLLVTNTGNIPLLATIANVFPVQIALDNLAHTQPLITSIDPGQRYEEVMTATVEAGYAGSLAGSVQVSTDGGVSASAQDRLVAQRLQVNPTAVAKGGNWYEAGSWEPPVVPPSGAVVLIPEDVFVYSSRPISVVGLVNHGTLELRSNLGNSQALTLTTLLENYGEILGRDALGAGQAGLTLNLTSAILYNEGTICAGDGAPNGGAGGHLIIIAGSTTNRGLFCAGNGADVNEANAGLPGGPGGDVLLAFDPGLFTNYGEVLAGNGGNSHPNASPPQPGGNGGDVTIVAGAAARVQDSDIRAGLGGQGSNNAPNGTIGKVVIGAPVINSQATRFSNGVVLLFDQSSKAFDFTAVGPDMVAVSPASGLAIFSIRIFNRGAATDTFVVSTLTTPAGWTVNNLPSTVTLRPFRSSLAFVVLAIPTDQAVSAIDQTLNIVVSSQNDAGNQVIVPLRIVSVQDGYRIQLPRISR